MPKSVSELLRRRAELDKEIQAAVARERESGKVIRQIVGLMLEHGIELADVKRELQQAAKSSPGVASEALVQGAVPAVEAEPDASAAPSKAGRSETDNTPQATAGESGARRGANRLVRQPMYRDPETGETWTGIGLRPAWIKRKLAAGRTLAEFTVAG